MGEAVLDVANSRRAMWERSIMTSVRRGEQRSGRKSGVETRQQCRRWRYYVRRGRHTHVSSLPQHRDKVYRTSYIVHRTSYIVRVRVACVSLMHQAELLTSSASISMCGCWLLPLHPHSPAAFDCCRARQQSILLRLTTSTRCRFLFHGLPLLTRPIATRLISHTPTPTALALSSVDTHPIRLLATFS